MDFLKIPTIIGIIILSSIESTTSRSDNIFNTTFDDIPFDIYSARNPRTRQSIKNIAATNIPPTEPVTVENTSLLIPSTSTIKTTPTVLTTDVSTSNTTVTGIISSSMAAVDSCSLLDLSVGKLPLDSKFMVFRNFSYDGSTFCLKWTIEGDLKDVKSCALKYTFEKGTRQIRVNCPLVNNEILTWRSKVVVYKICLDIYTPKKTSFCNYTLYGRTTAVVSETTPMLTETTSILQDSTTSIVTETIPFKTTETVRLTEDSINNQSDYFTISIMVYSNSSNTTSDMIWTTEPNMTSASSSTASIIENNTHTKDSLSNTTSNKFLTKHIYIPFICLLILLIITVAILIFKNMKKQSKSYDVLDKENKYDQRVKLSPQSTRDHSIHVSYLATENLDDE